LTLLEVYIWIDNILISCKKNIALVLVGLNLNSHIFDQDCSFKRSLFKHVAMLFKLLEECCKELSSAYNLQKVTISSATPLI
jgi:hypothetical protein